MQLFSKSSHYNFPQEVTGFQLCVFIAQSVCKFDTRSIQLEMQSFVDRNRNKAHFQLWQKRNNYSEIYLVNGNVHTCEWMKCSLGRMFIQTVNVDLDFLS